MKLEDANTGCDMQNAFQCESFVKMWGKKVNTIQGCKKEELGVKIWILVFKEWHRERSADMSCVEELKCRTFRQVETKKNLFEKIVLKKSDV